MVTILLRIMCWYRSITCCLVKTDVLDHVWYAALAASTAASISALVDFGTLVITLPAQFKGINKLIDLTDLLKRLWLNNVYLIGSGITKIDPIVSFRFNHLVIEEEFCGGNRTMMSSKSTDIADHRLCNLFTEKQSNTSNRNVEIKDLLS